MRWCLPRVTASNVRRAMAASTFSSTRSRLPTKDISLHCIPPGMVRELWWWLSPLVDRLVKRAHGEFTAGDLMSRASSADLLLWVVTPSDPKGAPLAILLIRLENWSGETVARVYGAAGSLKAIQSVMEEGHA